MLHAHRIRTLFVRIGVRFQIDRFRDLQTRDADRLNAECTLDADRAADAHRYGIPHIRFRLFPFFERKHLPERPHVDPARAGELRIFLLILAGFQLRYRVRALPQGAIFIIAPVVGLNEYVLPQVQKPVANLPFQADIGYLAESIIRGARPVAIQRIAVRVCVVHGEHQCEINFVFKLRHSFVPPALSVFFV